MNATLHITKLVEPGALLALALLAVGCTPIRRQLSETGGALGLRQITTAEEQSLKAGDSVAMVCTKCKSVIYLNLARSSKAARSTLEQNHPCPGCKASIKRVRVGKTHQMKITHVCEKCGEDSVFCCATKHGAPPISGVEEK